MFITITEGFTMLDAQFFMMKYGAFIVAGIVGSIASVSNDSSYNIKRFIKHLNMSIIFCVVFGILLRNFWELSLEVTFAITTLLAFFLKKVIVEINELLDSISDIARDFIKVRLGIKSKAPAEEPKVEEKPEQVDKEVYNEA